MSESRRLALHAVALFLIALVVRLPGIGWGLQNDLRNQSLHPDELVVYNFAQEIEPFRLHFAPSNYNYPTLYPTLLRLTGDAAVIYSGTPDPLSESRELTPAKWGDLAQHQRVFHLVGRVISCVAGAAFAFICFLIVAPRSMIGGWFAGLFAALAPTLIVHSRWQTVDMLAAAFFAGSLLFAVRILEAERHKDIQRLALWGAALAGLSAGTKYIGILALVSIFAALLIRRPFGIYRTAGYVLALSLGVFLVTTPGALLNTGRFLDGLEYEMRHTSEGRGLVAGDVIFVDTPSGFLFQLENLMLGSAPIAALVGLSALLAAAVLQKKWAWVLLASVVPLFVVVGMADVKFSRYAVPLFIAPAVGFGALVGVVARRPKVGAAAVVAASIGLVGVESPLAGIRGVLQYTAWMRGEDPRDQAARTVKGLAASDPDLDVGLVRKPWFWTVPVFPDANYSFHIPTQAAMAMLDNTSQPHVQFPIGEELPDIVVETNLETMHARRLRGKLDMTYEERATVDDLLRSVDAIAVNYSELGHFGSGPEPHVEDLRYVQPRVKVYRRTGQSQSLGP